MTNPPTKIPSDFNLKICGQAREYAERGWSCFPLSIGEKTPLDRWKRYQTEFVTEEEIDLWESQGAPRADKDGNHVGYDTMFNLALVTGAISGFVVVDCDSEQAVKYAKEHGLTSPISVKTSRGRHYYFRHPNNGRRFRNKAGNRPVDWHNCPGLDFRGDGGYVVSPPSISVYPDGTIKHEYGWVIETGIDFDDMPVWQGEADDIEFAEQFDFATLSLETANVGESSLDIREQIKKRVDHLGRKLCGPDCGDATDDWMIRFCGQMVRRGVVGQELADAVAQFHGEYFEFKGTKSERDRWLIAKIRSATEMDRRNHPEDYDAAGQRIVATPTKEESVPFKAITARDYDRLLKSLGDVAYHVDPLIPSRSIIQVVGYNGHGKSFFVTSLMNALAANNPQFGPYFIGAPAKVLYLDYDNPARTILNRLVSFAKQYGDTADNFNLWTPTLIPNEYGGNMNLLTKEGLEVLDKWLTAYTPDIVVIDTVRNAFGGMDEKSPQDWFKANFVAKVIRDKYKASVVMVHHRNKPNEQGLGREAGSTAQMTDLDTQIIVTQVYKDKNVAKTKAGLFDGDIVYERNGTVTTPFGYFEAKMQKAGTSQDMRLRTVVEVSFGKVREQTDLHRTSYIGWTENLHTGGQDMIWTPSVREDAHSLHKAGKNAQQIAQELWVPAEEIKLWLGVK